MNHSMGMVKDSERAIELSRINSTNPGGLTTLPDELLLFILYHLDDVSSISLGLVSVRIYPVVKSLFPRPIPLEYNIGNSRDLRAVLQLWLGPQYRLAFLRCQHAYFDFEHCTFLKKDVYGDLRNRAYKMEQGLQERYSEYRLSLVRMVYGDRKFGSLPSPCRMGEAWYEATVAAIGNDLLKRDTPPDEDSREVSVIFGDNNNAFLQAYKQYLDLLLQDDNLWQMEDYQT
ncbi:hypothetical protein B0J14DRAFT_659497 [Halenospora varia]|nr:hypothetical protein B0J14DRAFT_659497 [Halenospora varia]